MCSVNRNVFPFCDDVVYILFKRHHIKNNGRLGMREALYQLYINSMVGLFHCYLVVLAMQRKPCGAAGTSLAGEVERSSGTLSCNPLMRPNFFALTGAPGKRLVVLALSDAMA